VLAWAYILAEISDHKLKYRNSNYTSTVF